MDYRAYLSGVRFCLVDEQRPSLSSGGFAVLKSDGKEVELLDRPGVRIDAVNTLLPVDDDGMKQRLREVCLIPRMSTLAIGAIINYGVFLMDLDESFVNIGIWNGFTFLSGV